MKQLDSKAVWLFFISYMLRWLFLFVFLLVWGGLPLAFGIAAMTRVGTFSAGNVVWIVGGAFVLVLLLFTIFLWVWAKLSYHFYKYEIREDGFRKESGVIWKAYVTIPYDRIQNVDIYRGLIARLLKLSDLHVQTAGASVQVSRHGGAFGASAEGRLPGLSPAIAEELRDELIRRSRASRNTGQGL